MEDDHWLDSIKPLCPRYRHCDNFFLIIFDSLKTSTDVRKTDYRLEFGLGIENLFGVGQNFLSELKKGGEGFNSIYFYLSLSLAQLSSALHYSCCFPGAADMLPLSSSSTSITSSSTISLVESSYTFSNDTPLPPLPLPHTTDSSTR